MKDYIIEEIYFKDRIEVYKHYKGANGTLLSGERVLIKIINRQVNK